MNKFIYKGNLNPSELITLNEDESWHAVKVLRCQPGEEIIVLNGTGQIAQARINETHAKACTCTIYRVDTKTKPLKRLSLLVAAPKSSDRWEFILEKAQEFNVANIQPVFTRYSERKKINVDKGQKTIQAALKQCGAYFETELKAPIKFNEALSQYPPGLFGYCPSRENSPNHIGENQIVFIGPEGDFSKEEATALYEKGWKSVELGKNILRTESAAVAAMVLFENQ